MKSRKKYFHLPAARGTPAQRSQMPHSARWMLTMTAPAYSRRQFRKLSRHPHPQRAEHAHQQAEEGEDQHYKDAEHEAFEPPQERQAGSEEQAGALEDGQVGDRRKALQVEAEPAGQVVEEHYSSPLHSSYAFSGLLSSMNTFLSTQRMIFPVLVFFSPTGIPPVFFKKE